MSIQEGESRTNRFQGLVPSNPLPGGDEVITEAQRRQTELLRVYGSSGAAQQQASSVDTTYTVTPNQIRAGLHGAEVPVTSRQATAGEVAALFKPTVVFVGDDGDGSGWEKGSIEDQFLQSEKNRKKIDKKKV